MTDKIIFTANGERHELPIDGSRTPRVGSVSPSTELNDIKAIEPFPADDDDIDPELDLLRVAARAIEKHERLKDELRRHERHLSLVCQTYSSHYKIWGFRPEHLRQACVARGLLK
jgi:hypothetical protein